MRSDSSVSAPWCWLRAVAVVLVLVAAARTALAQACGGMQDLGTLPGGRDSEALGVSANGAAVVGNNYSLSTGSRAFRWTTGGGMQYLGTLPGGNDSDALGVSADGSVVVGYSSSSSGQRAFRWTALGGMQSLGESPEGVMLAATDVSADGSVVVGYCTSSSGYRAFRWTAMAGMQNLGTVLGQASSFANSVSADGSVVVGYTYGNSGYRAFRWTAAGGMQDLGTWPGERDSNAYGVSGDGSVVVGTSGNIAFRWTTAGGMQVLDTLPGSEERSSYAYGVSADGSVVVGHTYSGSGFLAFCWTAAEGMRSLGTLPGGWLSMAKDVSADGETVVGYADNGSGDKRAFRWAALTHQIDSLDALNESAHNTARYALNQPADNAEQRTILRRGSKPSPDVGTADFDVVVSECFNPQQHVLAFEAQHTFNGVPVVRDIPFFSQQVPFDEWGCMLREPLSPAVNGERIAKMRVFIPADGTQRAAVGEYTFSAVVNTPAGTRLEDRPFSRPVVILFNPWDPDDAVYLNDGGERDEYVMNERGAMWKGFARNARPISWGYNQFATDSLLASLDLLNDLDEEQRADPSVVSELLSSAIRNGDTGVLAGRWDGNYADGVNPLAWTSSDDIFRRYRTGGTVRYGQCWVYGGLLTSALRTMGIPSRPVTNFESADGGSDSSLVVGSCWTYVPLLDRWSINNEVWNFHVWCEGWMRSTAPSESWHVLDATEGIGPVPVSSVLARDTSTLSGRRVLREVDADVETSLRILPELICWPTGRLTTWVGRRITTKDVGSFGGVDITAQYKTPETGIDPRDLQDVQVDVPASSSLGGPILAGVTIRNFDAAERDFTCNVHVRAIAQDGTEIGVVSGPRTVPLTIAAGGVAVVQANVSWSELRPFAGKTEFFEVAVVVTRLNDESRWFRQSVSVLRGLPVTVALAPEDQVQQFGNVVATVTFSNPLTEQLSASTVTLTGGSGLPINGIASSEEVALPPLAPGAGITLTRTLSAAALGQQMFAAHWFVPELGPGDAMGSITILPPCPADFNADGFLTFEDFDAFVSEFEAGNATADFNADGFLTFEDFDAFVSAFEAGC